MKGRFLDENAKIYLEFLPQVIKTEAEEVKLGNSCAVIVLA